MSADVIIETRNLSKVVYGMGGVSGASANAKNEESTSLRSRFGEHRDGALNGCDINPSSPGWNGIF